MRFEQLALFSTLLLAVSAKLKITNPVNGTVWEFGKKNTVNWKHSGSDEGKQDLHLFFTDGVDPEKFRGKPVASVTVDDVTKDTTEFDLSKLEVDQFPPSVEEYFLRFGDVNGSYSHLFTINGGKREGKSDNQNNNGNQGNNNGNNNGNQNNSNDNNGNQNNNNGNNSDNNNDSNSANNENANTNNANANTNNANANTNNANANNANANANNATVINNANGSNPIANGNNTVNGNVANNANTANNGNQGPNVAQESNGTEKTIATSFVAVVAVIATLFF